MNRRAAAWLTIALRAPPALAGSDPPSDMAGAVAGDAMAPEAARLLVEEWGNAGYSERTVITRALVAMDDRAVAALVVAKRGKSASAREWAKETLESMGRERADEQIRTRSDEVLAGILRAFGEARDPDALGVLSSLVGSDRPLLRDAARAALLDFGEEARTKVRQDYAELTGTPAPGAWSAEQVARGLFEASDGIRLREVYALLDEGLGRADAGDTAGAVADFDAVLARQGDLRRPEIAGAYVSHAMSLEDRDPAAARVYFEKARRLAPDSPDARQSDSELALLEGRALEARGVPAEEPYRRALRLDPANPRARSALDRIRASAEARAARFERSTAWAALVLALLVAGVLFVGWRRASAHTGT